VWFWGSIASPGSDHTPDRSGPCERTPSQYTHIVDRALDGSLPRLPTAYDQRYLSFATHEAERFGLQLSNPAREIAAVRRARTAGAVLTALNAYTGSGFGFTVSLPSTPVGTGTDFVGLPVDRRESFAALRAGSVAFMRYLSRVPTGLVACSGLQQLTVVDHLYTGKNTEREGLALERDLTIYLELRSFSNPVADATSQEIGHLLDAAMCGIGGQQDDPQYAGLNPPGFRYGPDANTKDVATKYGATNIVEDKATEFQSMLGGLQKGLFDSDNTVLRRKYRLLLARLEEHVPGSARYYAAMSAHALPSAGTSSLRG